MPVDQLSSIRDRLLPMLSYGQNEYGYRVPAGYPIVHDDVERGAIGLEIGPMHSVHITTDGEQIYADIYYRSQRYDVRSSASREKFAGRPVIDRRPLGAHPTDQQLRNLVAELMSRFNEQQTIIYFTDD